MTRRALALAFVGLFIAGSASATVLETWTEISVQFTNLGRAEAADTEIGVTTVTGTGTGPHLQSITMGYVPGLALNTVLPVTDPIVSNGGIVEVRLTSVRNRPDLQGGQLGNISGAIASTAGGLVPATVPLSGNVRICLFFTGCTGSYLPLAVGGTTSLGGLTGIGVGGILTIGGTGTIMISILGAPYTVKTVTNFNRTNNGLIDTFMENGFAHGPASLTSSTAQTSGVLQVVTPAHFTITGVPGNGDIAGDFNRILVHFVPEPGLLVLLGSGAVGLAVIGRRRMRK